MQTLVCFQSNSITQMENQLQQVLSEQIIPLSNFQKDSLTLSIIAQSVEDLKEKLNQALVLLRDRKDIIDPKGIYFQHQPWGRESLAFLYPGQGSQKIGMLGEYHSSIPAYQRQVEALDLIWAEHIGFSIKDFIYQESNPNLEKKLKDTRKAQPALGFIEAALTNMLKDIGIFPEFIAGHSYGEYPALWFSGAFSLDTLAYLSQQRGQLLGDFGEKNPGAMLAIMSSFEALKDQLVGVEVANINSPNQFVVAGDPESIAEIQSFCRQKGIRAVLLKTSCAFHSSLLQPAGEQWRKVLEKMADQKAGFCKSVYGKVYSNVTGDRYPAKPEEVSQLLSQQITATICFQKMCETMYADGARIFLEVGPGNVLTGLVHQILLDQPHLALTCDYMKEDSFEYFLHVLGQLAAHGVPLDWQKFYQPFSIHLPHSSKQQRPSVELGDYFASNQEIAQSFFDQQKSILELVKNDLSLEEKGALATQLLQTNREITEDVLQTNKWAIEQVISRFDSGNDQPTIGKESNQITTPNIPTPPINHQDQVIETTPNLSADHTSSDQTKIDVKEWLRVELADLTGFTEEMITDTTHLEEDLGLNSITMAELAARLLKTFPNLQYDLTNLAGNLTLGEYVSSITPDTHKTNASKDHGSESEEVEVGLNRKKKRIETIISDVKARLGLYLKQDPTEIGADADFEKELNVNIFVLEDILHQALQPYPEFFPGRELIQVQNLAELEVLLLGFLPESPGEDFGVSRYIFQRETVSEDVVEKETPERILLIGEPGPTYQIFLTKFQNMGIKIHKLWLTKEEWILPDNQRIPLEMSKELTQYLARVTVDVDEKLPIVYLALGQQSLDSQDWICPEENGFLVWEGEIERAIVGLYLLLAGLVDTDSEMINQIKIGIIGSEKDSPAWSAARGGARSFRFDFSCPIHTFWLTESAEKISLSKICQQLFSTETGNDFIVDKDQIRCSFIQKKLLVKEKQPLVNIQPDTPILLLGGGAGITAEIGYKLAQEYQCHLIAIGRTPWNGENPYPDIVKESELKRQVVQEFIAELGAENVTRDMVEKREKKVFRQREIWANANRIQATGGAFHYYNTDITNQPSLQATLTQINKEFGPIQGLIHGAGIVNSSSKTSLDSFRRVLYTKAHSILYLYQLLKDQPLQFAIFFSSLAAYTGRPGLADYTAANEVLNEFAQFWNRQVDYPVRSILWSIWTETGLAKIKSGTKHLGLTGISNLAGSQLFIDELLYGDKEDVQVLLTPDEDIEYASQIK